MLPRTRLLNFGRYFSRLQGRTLQTGAVSTGSATRSAVPRLTLMGGSTIAVLMWVMPASASCAEGDEGTEDVDDVEGAIEKSKSSSSSITGDDAMDKFIRVTLYPAANKLGFGGIMGFCSGVAIKKIGEHMIYWCGIGFIGIQVAQYKGYIEIDWFKVREQAIAAIDVDGDGEISTTDLQAYWLAFKNMMAHAVPSSAGFGAGFALGLYYS